MERSNCTCSPPTLQNPSGGSPCPTCLAANFSSYGLQNLRVWEESITVRRRFVEVGAVSLAER